MTGKIWIALYRPHEGQEENLRKLVAQHYPTLKRLELISDRPGIIAKSANATILEIAEWRGPDSSAKAHHHPEIAKIWEAMNEIADFPGLSSLPEADKPFPHFDPVDIS